MQKFEVKLYDIYVITSYGYIYKNGTGIISDESVDDIINKKIYNPKEGDSLYFDKRCKIPRLKLDKFKRCIKKEKADCYIIPNKYSNILSSKSWYKKPICHVNKNNNVLVIGDFKEIDKDSLNNGLQMQLYKIISSLEYEDVDIKYLLVGKEDFYQNIMEFDKIAFESDIAKVIHVTEDKKINEDMLKEISVLLRSSDNDNKKLALRLLSELDYVTYKNAIRMILSLSYHHWYNVKGNLNCNSVKYMFDYIGPIFDNVQMNKISAEEFYIIKSFIEQKISYLINDFKNRVCDDSIIIDTNINVRLTDDNGLCK